MKITLLKITDILYYFFIVIGFIMAFFYNKNNFHILVPFSLFILIFFSRRIFKFSVREFFLAVICGYLSLIGTLGIYRLIVFYDKILHFLIVFVIGLMINKRVLKEDSNGFIYFVCFLSIIGVGALWEIFEYLFDLSVGGNLQSVFNVDGRIVMSSINDTMVDLIAGLFGAALSIRAHSSKYIQWVMQ